MIWFLISFHYFPLPPPFLPPMLRGKEVRNLSSYPFIPLFFPFCRPPIKTKRIRIIRPLLSFSSLLFLFFLPSSSFAQARNCRSSDFRSRPIFPSFFPPFSFFPRLFEPSWGTGPQGPPDRRPSMLRFPFFFFPFFFLSPPVPFSFPGPLLLFPSLFSRLLLFPRNRSWNRNFFFPSPPPPPGRCPFFPKLEGIIRSLEHCRLGLFSPFPPPFFSPTLFE